MGQRCHDEIGRKALYPTFNEKARIPRQGYLSERTADLVVTHATCISAVVQRPAFPVSSFFLAFNTFGLFKRCM